MNSEPSKEFFLKRWRRKIRVLREAERSDKTILDVCREQLWALTEARVVIEDWRWKYNNIRPHRSLGYITPLEFSQELLEETEPNQCRASSRPTASLRPDIDKLYNINHIINTSRLTKAMAQFG